LDDYAAAFDPGFHLGRLSRRALARLGREYMLYYYLRDRTLLPAVALRFGLPAMQEIVIDEWMGASPIYNRRVRRAMRIGGDGVTAIMKSLQLDVGFAHRWADVRYEIQDEHLGFFWLEHCGPLLDSEPLGEKAVISMCVHMEDPTFDATAYAVNPRARLTPVHRPPRRPPDRVPHCRWKVCIDPQVDPAPEPPTLRSVRACRLADFELDPPDVPDGEGLSDYSGPFVPRLRLEDLSRRALVTVCKEFMLQNQLLARSSMIAIENRFGEQASREMILAQWLGLAPLSTRRIRKAMAIGGDDAAAILKVLQLHPAFPHDYARLGFELSDSRRGAFWLEECAALDDAEPRGFFSLLDRTGCPGLDAMVQALNPRARCRPVDPGFCDAARLAWELVIDGSAPPAEEPAEAGFLQRGYATDFDLEDGGSRG
jgi:hypothetical protein